MIKSLLNVDDNSLVGKVVSRHPGILALGSSNLESKIRWLVDEFGEVGGKRIFLTAPSVASLRCGRSEVTTAYYIELTDATYNFLLFALASLIIAA